MAAAPLLLGLLALFVAYLISYMLLTGYRFTLGALLQAIVHVADSVNLLGWHPFRALGELAENIDQWINAALSDAVLATERAWRAVLHATGYLIYEMAKGLRDLAQGTYSAISHAVERTIPRLIHDLTMPLWGAVHSLSHQLAYLWRVVTSLSHELEHLAGRAIPETKIIVKRYVAPAVKAATVTLPHEIIGAVPRLGNLDRVLHGIDETLKDTLKKVSPAALAAVFVGSVLSITGLSWLRCGNVGRAGKAICGLNANVLEGLLAGLLSIFGTIGIVAFAKDVQGVVSEFGSEVGHFWRADAIGSGGDRSLGSATLD